MKRQRSILWMAAAVIATLALAGCSKSGKGESCRSRTDCKAGLFCAGQVCSVLDFPTRETANFCHRVECNVDADCCQPPSPFCDEWSTQCTGGDVVACASFNTYCQPCSLACDMQQCVVDCTTSADCSLGDVCVANRCVECAVDTDCPAVYPGYVCKENACERICIDHEDCPYLYACQANACVHVGCTTDRECRAYRSHGEAICVPPEKNPDADATVPECVIPCNFDAECDTEGFEQCINGFCIYVGCETNEECRIYLSIPIGSTDSAVCGP